MRYCPKCRGEYQDWAEKCADCGAALIDYPPEPKLEPGTITVNKTSYTNEPLVIVAEYSNFVDAQLSKDILEAEGITSFVPDMDSGASSWAGGSPLTRPIVVVRESDVQKATEILKSVENENPDVFFPGGDDDVEADDEETKD